MKRAVKQAPRLEGVVAPPGDKSISHRAALLNTVARGTAHVSNFCVGDDRAAMLRCLRVLGAEIEPHTGCSISQAEECLQVNGLGPDGLREPDDVLDAGNSGTTMRLVSGLLAAQPFLSVITGDASLRSRPMKRILVPLERMGAKISARQGGSMAPLVFEGGDLHGIRYEMPGASAQLKSSILIAGLYADGETSVVQPAASRDHTERMMKAMGADLVVEALNITIRRSQLESVNVDVPCDISGAAFWLVAGCAHPNASITVKGVGINPTRLGVLEVLREMGANIRMENIREDAVEPYADLVAESSDLTGVEIAGEVIPRVIDELPVLALAASMASGTTVIRDAAELRVKESDRIEATLEGLSRLGVRVQEHRDGMSIQGGAELSGAEVRSHGDHRIAMTMAVAGLVARGETTVDGAEAADVSYPDFWETMAALR